jgi:hypothetical protein
MPPFLQFRMWLREGPRGERVATAVVSLVVLVVAGAALVPVGRGGSAGAEQLDAAGGSAPNASASGPPAQSAAGAGATTGAATGGTTGAAGAVPGAGGAARTAPAGGSSTTGSGSAAGLAPGAPAGQSGGAAATGCGTRTASAPGITPTQVHLDMANLSLAGPVGNSTFNVRPDLAKIADAIAADINEHGGVACGRKLVLKQYDVNPLDSNDSQSKCLQMAADKPFMVFNLGAYLTPAARQCLVQAKLLEQSATQVDQQELTASYPYLFTGSAVAEQMVDATIAGMAKRGFFKGPKFTKLGLFEDSCSAPVNKEVDAALARAGVGPSQVSKYVLDCNIASPPNQVEQGVLQHKGALASHVLLLSSETNGQNYVRIANGQDFHPQYVVSDYGSNTSGSGTENWGAPFDGAVGITTTRVGEFSSGIHNRQAVACDSALRAHGVNGVQSESKDTSALGYCDLFAVVRQALDRAGVNPSQQSFLQALSTMGLFRTAVEGDGNFNRAGKLTGGDFERQIVYRNSCGCWKVVDRVMAPVTR